MDGLSFGLDKRTDRLGLYAPDGSYVNAVGYQLPASEDSAFVYALALPGLDNTRATNWVREGGLGSPGLVNPAHLQRALVSRASFWARIGFGVAVLLAVGLGSALHLRSRQT